MKHLYIVGGTMGVGKTAVCQHLKTVLSNCVFLDGDWCWNADPFVVTEETKAMVIDNICHLLNNFLRCSAYENIVFCWVMHEQAIIDRIVGALDISQCELRVVSLMCSEATLRQRLAADVASGLRDAHVIERSVQRLPLYENLNTIKIITDDRAIEDVAGEIIDGEQVERS